MRDKKQHNSPLSTAELSNGPIQPAGHKPAIIDYLNIPLIIFLLLNLLTSGLYGIYWLYHNWKAIKKADKSDISPFWRAVFAVFFIDEFFQHVCKDAKNQGYRGFMKYRLLNGYYVTFLVLTWLCALLAIFTLSGMINLGWADGVAIFAVILLYVLAILFGVLKLLCFWPIQKAINFYKDQVEQEYLSTITNQDCPVIGYFDISPIRFLLFNILSARLYLLYWSYKNWQAIKRAEKRNILPFWRSIFPVFFIHSLFKIIYLSAKGQGFQERIPYWQLVIGYIFSFYLLALLGRLAGLPALMSETWYYIFVLSVGVTFDFLLFRPIQKAINFYNSKVIVNYQPRTRFTHGEVMLVIIGMIFYISLFTGMLNTTKIPSTFPKSPENKLTVKPMAWKTLQSTLSSL